MMLLSLLAGEGGEGKTRRFLSLLLVSTVLASLHVIAGIALNMLKLPVATGGEGNMVHNIMLLGLSLSALTASR